MPELVCKETGCTTVSRGARCKACQQPLCDKHTFVGRDGYYCDADLQQQTPRAREG